MKRALGILVAVLAIAAVFGIHAYLDARHLSASAILLTPLEETFRCVSGADLAFL